MAKVQYVNLPVKEYDTFGGFVFACYGFVPEDGWNSNWTPAASTST